MHIALLQTDIHWRAPEENFAQAANSLAGARALGARLAILPEMFSHGFCMDSALVAEAPDGPSTEFLRSRARALDMYVCGSIPITPSPTATPVNRFICAGPDGSIAHYDKMHPFTLAGEQHSYDPGQVITTFTVDGLRITPFICYDLRFANVFWSAAADTDLYIVIANWPAKRRQAFSTLLRARAIENQAYVAGVNRVGDGDGLHYDGGSALIDPQGQTLAELTDAPGICIVDIDTSAVAKLRAGLPFLADRLRESAASPGAESSQRHQWLPEHPSSRQDSEN